MAQKGKKMGKIVFFWEKLEILHNLEILSKNSFEYLLLLKKLLKKKGILDFLTIILKKIIFGKGNIE